MTRIVVGVEPTPEGRRALDLALAEAVSRRLPLTAVRAWAPSTLASYPAGALTLPVTDEAAQAQALAGDELKRATERVLGADQIETQAIAVPSGAAPVLVDLAAGAALLVVGSRGWSACALRPTTPAVTAWCWRRCSCTNRCCRPGSTWTSPPSRPASASRC